MASSSRFSHSRFMASSSLVVVGISIMLTFLSVSADDTMMESSDEMMMAAPEPEFELATSRSRVNQDPATLSRPELRYGNYLPQLARGRRLLDSHEAAPAPEMGEMDLTTTRARLAFAPGRSFDAKDSPALLAALGNGRRRQLLDSHEAAAAPAPAEDEEGTLELATERGRLGGRTGYNFGTQTLYTQDRFDNRRHLLEAHGGSHDHDHDHDHEAV